MLFDVLLIVINNFLNNDLRHKHFQSIDL